MSNVARHRSAQHKQAPTAAEVRAFARRTERLLSRLLDPDEENLRLRSFADLASEARRMIRATTPCCCQAPQAPVGGVEEKAPGTVLRLVAGSSEGR